MCESLKRKAKSIKAATLLAETAETRATRHMGRASHGVPDGPKHEDALTKICENVRALK